jgi:hypothetical protein
MWQGEHPVLCVAGRNLIDEAAAIMMAQSAHMRYSVRRLRRKLPKAAIILGCWFKEIRPDALESLRDGAKADLVAATLGEAVKLCIDTAKSQSQAISGPEKSTIVAA